MIPNVNTYNPIYYKYAHGTIFGLLVIGSFKFFRTEIKNKVCIRIIQS